MTASRTIPGALDYGRLFPDADAIRGQARLDARDAVRRALAAVQVAAADESCAARRDGLQVAHAALCDAIRMIEATL